MSMFKKKSKSLEIFFVLISFIGLFFLLALIFSNFFLFWAGQEYQNIGSMISGVFGSAAAFAGSIVAIALAWIALKISYKQAFLEDEKVIDCFILDRINPALKNISDLLIQLKLFRSVAYFIDEKGFNDYSLELLKSRAEKILGSVKKLLNDKITLVFIENIYNRDCMEAFNSESKKLGNTFQHNDIQDFIKAQVNVFDVLFINVLYYSIALKNGNNKKLKIQDHPYYTLFHIFAEGLDPSKNYNISNKNERIEREKILFEVSKKLIKDSFPDNIIIKNEHLLNQKLKSLLYTPAY